ncbi:MAG: hypothetical protein RBU27_13345 [Bacteroidota bacterium]|jgi:hypothetical protein|nr:hypothetical protein [Bacteroidota bacterium]
MKRTYTYVFIFVIVALIFAPVVSRPPGLTVQAQNTSVHDAEYLQKVYTAATGRFIENGGQFGHEVLYAASSPDNWVYFHRDRIVVVGNVATSFIDAPEFQSRIDSTFLTAKRTRSMENSMLNVQRRIRTVHLYNNEPADTPHSSGRRLEKVHYMLSESHGGSAVAVTWDSLIYRSIDAGLDLFLYFSNGDLKWNCRRISHGDTLLASCPRDLNLVLQSAFRERRNDTNAPISNITTNNSFAYSTLLGGSGTDGIFRCLEVDESTYILVGNTKSPDFPIAGEPWDDEFNGDTASIYSRMVFIACLDIVRNQLLFSTYFGGSDLDAASMASIDGLGNIVIAGSTWSDDLPVTPNAWQSHYRGHGDGFIAALNATGSELVFCSYIGGSGIENLSDMKIDVNGNIVITGLTDSWNYPTTPGVVQSKYGGGGDDIFVTKFNHDASKLVFSTFVGGGGWDEGRSLDFTPDGNILVAGYTNSNDFPVTPDALYGGRAAFDEGCVLILTPGGRRMVYSSYIGWDTHEDASRASLDADGVMTVFGITTSSNLPVNESSFQKQKGEAPSHHKTSEDFYVLKYRLTDCEILGCTYIGGSSRDRYPWAFMVLPDGNILVGGSGTSEDYPITTEASPTNSQDYAIQLSILDFGLTMLKYSIRFGGNKYSYLYYASLNNNNLIITGFTSSLDYPLTSNAHQTELKGATDAFFTIIDLSSVLSCTAPPLAPATTDIEAYPQPAGTTFRLIHRLEASVRATVTLHDYLGRLLRRTSVQAGSDGLLRVELDVADLRPGVYDCRITAGDRSSRRMILIMR